MRHIWVLVLAIFIVSCEDNPVESGGFEESESGILVLNEGLYGQNNSSFTNYNISDNSVSKNPYHAVNGYTIGDTGNDMEVYGDKIYVAVANSNKIEIVSLRTFESLGFVDLGEGVNPRELVVIDSTRLYVTSLYDDKVYRVNPVTKSVEKKISVGSLPEGITLSGNYLFTANSGFSEGNTISVIDITTDTNFETLTVGYNPRIMFTTPNGTVYAVCTGVYDETGRGGIYKINPESVTVTDSLIINHNPGETTFAGDDYGFVFNNDGIFRIKLNNLSENIIYQPYIETSEINPAASVVYSLYYDNTSKILYAGNPMDYLQNGSIVMFDAEGNRTGEFECGLNPGTILKYQL